MTDYQVRRSQLQGAVVVPSSKSHSIRAVIYGAMGAGESYVQKVLDSTDVQAAVRACRALGATILQEGESYRIQGVSGRPTIPDDVIDAGNSGLVLRYSAALGALSEGYTVITGDRSIRSQRPMQPILNGLRGLGAFAESTRENGLAPVIIGGPILPGKTRLSGEDSQPVSALLTAAAFLRGTTEVWVDHPGEIPWMRFSLKWLDRLGIRYENEDFRRYRICGNGPYPGFSFTVPGDFSSAAFLIVAALVTQSELTLHNVDMEDSQGDKVMISVLRQMGAKIEVDASSRSLRVERGANLRGITIDLNEMIDAVTILAVVGCFATGETQLINGAIARRKECDRIACIARELRLMGADLSETADGLVVRPARLRGAQVDSHHDHRMAMSLAVAGMASDGVTTIRDVTCVDKTYKLFPEQLCHLGADLMVRHERGSS